MTPAPARARPTSSRLQLLRRSQRPSRRLSQRTRPSPQRSSRHPSQQRPSPQRPRRRPRRLSQIRRRGRAERSRRPSSPPPRRCSLCRHSPPSRAIHPIPPFPCPLESARFQVPYRVPSGWQKKRLSIDPLSINFCTYKTITAPAVARAGPRCRRRDGACSVGTRSRVAQFIPFPRSSGLWSQCASKFHASADSRPLLPLTVPLATHSNKITYI